MKVVGQAYTTPNPASPSHISFSIHLFELAKINSEIKYVTYSVQRQTPSYALPAIRDIHEWQLSVIQRLDAWCQRIPNQLDDSYEYACTTCKIQYHTTKMLLLRPSPGIPCPTTDSRRQCYELSVCAIRLFDQLYRKDLLIYNWNATHAIILHAFCILHSIVTVPSLASEVQLGDLLSNLRAVSNMLSSIGNFWAGAKRSCEMLDELTSRVVGRILASHSSLGGSQQTTQSGDSSIFNRTRASYEGVLGVNYATNADMRPSTSTASPGYEDPHEPRPLQEHQNLLATWFGDLNDFDIGMELSTNDLDFQTLFGDNTGWSTYPDQALVTSPR